MNTRKNTNTRIYGTIRRCSRRTQPELLRALARISSRDELDMAGIARKLPDAPILDLPRRYRRDTAAEIMTALI